MTGTTTAIDMNEQVRLFDSDTLDEFTPHKSTLEGGVSPVGSQVAMEEHVGPQRESDADQPVHMSWDHDKEPLTTLDHLQEEDKQDRLLIRQQYIASTGNTLCTTVAACHPQREYKVKYNKRDIGLASNCFRSAQLSRDGSTVVTYNEDQEYRSFIL